MLGVFAEFETNLRRERQLESIADAKARGVYKGRKPSGDPAKVKKMKADGMGPSAAHRFIGGSPTERPVALRDRLEVFQR
jgi:DNA invertase Pin-like site-specific DNA recombinase